LRRALSAALVHFGREWRNKMSDTKLWLFGHHFRAMTNQDYQGFAGASNDALICYAGSSGVEEPSADEDVVVLIYEPDSQELTVIDGDGSETVWKSVSLFI
jgi:hypothetical protein